MILILLVLALSALKYMEFSFMVNVSWWWIGGLFFFTFIWFEFIEHMLGLDKKKAHKKFDEIQKNRAKKNFNKK